MVYEPVLGESEFFGSRVFHDLDAFKQLCDVVIANQQADELMVVVEKVYTRDLFGSD